MDVTCMRLFLFLIWRRRPATHWICVTSGVNGGVEGVCCTYVAKHVSRPQEDVASRPNSFEEQPCHHHFCFLGMPTGTLLVSSGHWKTRCRFLWHLKQSPSSWCRLRSWGVTAWRRNQFGRCLKKTDLDHRKCHDLDHDHDNILHRAEIVLCPRPQGLPECAFSMVDRMPPGLSVGFSALLVRPGWCESVTRSFKKFVAPPVACYRISVQSHETWHEYEAWNWLTHWWNERTRSHSSHFVEASVECRRWNVGCSWRISGKLA
jgi:hypothetical protein